MKHFLTLLAFLCTPLFLGTAFAQDSSVTVSDLYGEVTLEKQPERIVVLTDEMTEIVVALGTQPVGVSSTRFDYDVGEKAVNAGYLAPALDNAIFVGGAEPSLEAITALKPDLIVASANNEAIVPQLSEIAPTLTFSLDKAGDWQAVMKTLGVATGRTAAAEAAEATYQNEVATLRERTADLAAMHPTVNLIYPQYRGGEENFIFDETFGLGGNLSALGFTPVVPEGVEMTPQGFGTLSTEAFSSLDADTVLSVGVGERQDNAVNRLLDATGATLAYVDIGLGRPPQGPLSDLFYMERFADAIRTLYSISTF